MDLNISIIGLLITIALGFIIGSTNEYRMRKGAKIFMGLRSVIFLTMLGYLFGVFTITYNSFYIALIGIGFSIAIGGEIYAAKSKNFGPTATTFISTPLIFITGLLVGMQSIIVGVIIGLLVMAFSFYKHTLIDALSSISDKEFIGGINLLVIGLLVLLFLPNKNIFLDFNPFSFWLIFVIVAAIFFVEFILYNHIKEAARVFTIVGSLISSTATTYALNVNLRRFNYRAAVLNGVLSNSIMLMSQVVIPILLLAPSLFNSFTLLIFLTIASIIFGAIVGEGKLNKIKSSLPIKNVFIFAAMLFVLIMVFGLLKSYSSILFIVSIIGGAANMLAVSISLASLYNLHQISQGLLLNLLFVALSAAMLEKVAFAFISHNKKYILLNFVLVTLMLLLVYLVL